MARARRTDAVLSHLGSKTGTDGQAARMAGSIVAETYTPEEKLRLEQALNAEAVRIGPVFRDAHLDAPGDGRRVSRPGIAMAPRLDGSPDFQEWTSGG